MTTTVETAQDMERRTAGRAAGAEHTHRDVREARRAEDDGQLGADHVESVAAELEPGREIRVARTAPAWRRVQQRGDAEVEAVQDERGDGEAAASSTTVLTIWMKAVPFMPPMAA